MHNKTGVILLAIVITVLCLYNLSFTFIAANIRNDAEIHATDSTGKIDESKKQKYLKDLSLSKEPVFSILGIDYSYNEIMETELSLGLDLQGGMHVTLEISPIEILKVMSGNSTDPAFLKSLDIAEQKQKNSQSSFTLLFYESYKELKPNARLSSLFANLANKDRIDSRSTDEEVLKFIDEEVESAVDRSFEIINTRIDKFGVAQPNIRKIQGTGRIQIELPGVDDPERIRNLLQGVAKLEFYEAWQPQEIYQYLLRADQLLLRNKKAEAAPVTNESEEIAGEENSDSTETAASTLEEQLAGNSEAADSLGNDSTKIEQTTILFNYLTPVFNGFIAEKRHVDTINLMLDSPEIKALFPADVSFLWGFKSSESEDGEKELSTLYALKKQTGREAPLTGEVVTDAGAELGPRGYEVNMRMNALGANKWKKMTGDVSARRTSKEQYMGIAIVLDDLVYSAPNVEGEIAGGNSRISGDFTKEEAEDLANVLKAGKLPAPTRIVEEAVVGPSLGEAAINRGLISTLAGFALVVIFMIMYYGKGGSIADLVLLFNIFFILGILAQLGASLTLDGIAGIVLTIGMAVDANVLIFERIREEIDRGQNIRNAIKTGYKKAFSAIIDSNITTFLVGLVLFTMASGSVKGFATTLMIGIASSFFTAVFISRVIVELMVGKKETGSVSFSTIISKNLFKKINYNIIGNRRKAYMFSVLVIALGVTAVVIKGGFSMGVDFKGGRSYIVQFDKDVKVENIRKGLSDELSKSGTSLKTFDGLDKIQITTAYLVNDESNEADEKVKSTILAGFSEFEGLNPEIVSTSKVGATVADDVERASKRAIIISIIGIFLYLMVRFRRWQFGLGAVIALFHDVLVVFSMIGILSLFGITYQIDQVMVAAVLTVIGYSINDTVVVFDRVREFLTENPRADISKTINDSVNSTLSRTVITSFCTLLVVLVLFIFGGEVLRGFSFALLVGIIVGTYSSIFVATPVVVDFAKKKLAAGYAKKG